MPEMIQVNIGRPVTSVRVADPGGEDSVGDDSASQAELAAKLGEVEQLKRQIAADQQRLAVAVAAVETAGAKLKAIHEQAMADYPSQVVAVGVEIARRVLVRQIESGDYDIAAIVERAINSAPVKDGIAVRLNKADAQVLQEAGGSEEGRFKGVKLIGDDAVGRAECVVETPRGIVDYFVDDQLERIADVILNMSNGE